MNQFLNNHKETVLGLALIVIIFYAGRYTAPTKVETKTVTVEVEKEQKHENKVVVQRIGKDGTTTVITHVITDTNTSINKIDRTDKVIENNKPSLNVYAMAGLDVSNPQNGFVFGAHVSKQILGPVSIGLFGLTNKTIGASVGFSF